MVAGSITLSSKIFLFSGLVAIEQLYDFLTTAIALLTS
jgi:hypothetical protein